MKPCTYCGRENDDTANHCSECGTEDAATGGETEPGPLLTPDRLRFLLKIITIVGMMLLGICIYLLSFGPVLRWTAKITNTPPPAVVTAVSTTGGTTAYSKTISFPSWVGVIYHPAFALMNWNAGTFGELYQRYIEWWVESSP